VVKLLEKNKEKKFYILKITEEARSGVKSGPISERHGSGSEPKCHGFPALVFWLICLKIEEKT